MCAMGNLKISGHLLMYCVEQFARKYLYRVKEHSWPTREDVLSEDCLEERFEESKCEMVAVNLLSEFVSTAYCDLDDNNNGGSLFDTQFYRKNFVERNGMATKRLVLEIVTNFVKKYWNKVEPINWPTNDEVAPLFILDEKKSEKATIKFIMNILSVALCEKLSEGRKERSFNLPELPTRQNFLPGKSTKDMDVLTEKGFF